MTFQKLLPFLILLACFSCKGQTKQYNPNYSVRPIDSFYTFSAMTSQEYQMDSIIPANRWFNGAFRNNRSRIFLESFTNGKVQSGADPGLSTGLPAPCMCFMDNDTIYIKTWIGFFGAIGFGVKIYKEDFNSEYIIQIDKPDAYKVNLSVKEFTGQAIVGSKYQQLTFLAKPSFKSNDQLTGLLELTSNSFYEKSNDNSVGTVLVVGKVYFTCKTRQMTMMDRMMYQNSR